MALSYSRKVCITQSSIASGMGCSTPVRGGKLVLIPSSLPVGLLLRLPATISKKKKKERDRVTSIFEASNIPLRQLKERENKVCCITRRQGPTAAAARIGVSLLLPHRVSRLITQTTFFLLPLSLYCEDKVSLEYYELILL